MASMLQAIIDDPSPGPSVQAEKPWRPSDQIRLSATARRALDRFFTDKFDQTWAGWGTIHKYVDRDAIEYALSDARTQPMARRTLDAALALIDPVWGGMYQYSDAVDWQSPHYEKIMEIQAHAIEAYTAAHAVTGDPRYLTAARAIGRYLRERMTGPEGAFYTSQDADLDERTPGKAFYALDDAGRQQRGQPRIDTHLYPRENGWAIRAFVQLFKATQEIDWLNRARRAAEWTEAHRLNDDGSYRHGEADRAGPYLGDTLAMADAQLALAEVDAGGPWLARAVRSAAALERRFGDAAGLTTAPVTQGATGVLARPAKIVDENVAVGRLALRLVAATGDPRWHALHHRAMRYLTSPTLVEVRPFAPGVLVLDAASAPPARAARR
jgi:uncharacterized protein YyaL (SSP411 family)